MSKGNSYLNRIKSQIQEEKEKTRAHTLQHTLDVCTIALGRLGWREKRLERFARKVEEVVDDYHDLVHDDRKWNDKDIVYTIECFEKELKTYCGSQYWPREKRYE